jgi:ParB family transcriptional regulator, chromosome partitioning protein
MTTVLESKATQAVPPTVSSMQDIPLAHIQESKTNPRRQFDEVKLAELAESIRLHGVLHPVLVRPLAGGEAGFYELVAGARRYRASKLEHRGTVQDRHRETVRSGPPGILEIREGCNPKEEQEG